MNKAFYGEDERPTPEDPITLYALIGSYDWPDSIIEACAEIMEAFKLPVGIMERYRMPRWIN